MRPRIRTNTLTGYAGLAGSLGLDPAALMAAVGLDIADLDVPDRWIPAAPAARLLDLSAQQADCPDFGLRMAELRRLGTLGPLGVVLRDEPDLRSAVELLARYERAYNEALHLRLREADGQATIEVWLEFAEPTPGDQALDLVMAALLGIIRALVGSDWHPQSAAFSRPSPPDAGPWRRLFGPGVAFDRELTGLIFSARELETPVVTSDSSLRPYTQEFLRTVVAPRAPAAASGLADVVEAVELLLPLRRHSMQQVSRHLGLRPRGLQRYLTDRGETFSSVVHATRARLAERYLPNERYTLTEVSQLLGFEAPSAFSRWFRQQFGASPTEWRRTVRAQPRARAGTDGPDERQQQGRGSRDRGHEHGERQPRMDAPIPLNGSDA
jgi:AraC-like DNA-binding protein